MRNEDEQQHRIRAARRSFEWQKWLNRMKTTTPRHYLGRLKSNGMLHPVCRESGLLGTEVINHLRHHGIEAALHRTESRNGDVATALISEAKRRKADLIIMGGYGHSRFREQLLGRVTDNLLHQRVKNFADIDSRHDYSAIGKVVPANCWQN